MPKSAKPADPSDVPSDPPAPADAPAATDPIADPPADVEGGFSARMLRFGRSRFREEAHGEAHDDEPPQTAAADGPAHPLVPQDAAKLIAAQRDFDALLKDLRQPQPAFGGRPCFSYDSEFIGESSYFPKLCLIQIGTPQGVWLVDPLAGLDLSGFWQLVGDATIRKIVHAGEQDLEPAWRLAGVRPANVFDTQVSAGLAALPYPSSLQKLVEHVLGVRLFKGLTVTQWDLRPLSKKQLAYAADDVRYLPAVTAELDARLAEIGHAGWAQEECDNRSETACRTPDAELAWERVKGAGSLNGRELAILRLLAIWRDRVARGEDLPPRALLKDEVLISLARRPPKDAAKLRDIKFLPRPVADRFGGELMAVLEEGRRAAPMDVASRPPEPTLREKFDAESLWAVVQATACARGIDPALVTSRRDIDALHRRLSSGKGLDKHPLLNGWRREAVGEALLGAVEGRPVGLKWSEGRLRVS